MIFESRKKQRLRKIVEEEAEDLLSKYPELSKGEKHRIVAGIREKAGLFGLHDYIVNFLTRTKRGGYYKAGRLKVRHSLNREFIRHEIFHAIFKVLSYKKWGLVDDDVLRAVDREGKYGIAFAIDEMLAAIVSSEKSKKVPKESKLEGIILSANHEYQKLTSSRGVFIYPNPENPTGLYLDLKLLFNYLEAQKKGIGYTFIRMLMEGESDIRNVFTESISVNS